MSAVETLRVWIRIAGIACVFAALGVALSARAETPPSGPVIDRLRAEGRIVIAHRSASVPFSYLGPDGRPIGYALDLCERLVQALRQRLELPELAVVHRLVSPADRLDVIAQGKAQLECGSTTNNAERRQRVAFTIPHYITGARLLVRADSPIDRIDHPALLRVVSTRNTTPLAAVRRIKAMRNLPLDIAEADDHEQALRQVERGEAQAFVMDDVLLFGLIAQRPDPRALAVRGRFLTTEPLAIMLPPGDPAFKAIVDGEMRRLILGHEIEAIYRRWFEQPIPPHGQALNLPMSYLLRDSWKYPSDQVP